MNNNVRSFLYFILKLVSSQRIFLNRLLFWLDRERYLLDQGAKVGRQCRIEKFQFPSEPYLIKLGNHVSIGENVQFITHDGGVWVIRELLNDPKLDFFGTIEIGNNVFVGNNVIILPGTIIGDNVVVGAGAVVCKDVPSGQVVAGVPARVISSIENYIQRKRNKCFRSKGLSCNEKRKLVEDELSNHNCL